MPRHVDLAQKETQGSSRCALLRSELPKSLLKFTKNAFGVSTQSVGGNKEDRQKLMRINSHPQDAISRQMVVLRRCHLILLVLRGPCGVTANNVLAASCRFEFIRISRSRSSAPSHILSHKAAPTRCRHNPDPESPARWAIRIEFRFRSR